MQHGMGDAILAYALIELPLQALSAGTRPLLITLAAATR